MHSGSNKYARSHGYRELRELHRLYNKCEPVRVFNPINGPVLGVCTCGRILKRPGQTCWNYDAAIARGPGWTKLTHADKKRIRRIKGYSTFIKRLRQ